MAQTHPKVAAIAVILRDDKFLLVQRGKDPGRGLWGFPGGHVEMGESAKEAAARELFEETRVTADPIDVLTAVDIIGHDEEGAVAYHYLLAVVHCEYRSGEAVAGDDAAAVEWVPAQEVINAERGLNQGVVDVAKQVWKRRS
ncbi:NUDIX hydrolase [Cognatishimia activa]|uniref:Phosphatase NudJ n=1 Tax=Cognatishimia activa TaxID=1715691 RepID=A0A0P1IQN1_9RHOB|nr:NUDIX hydrolase [Cognatishimia activa]CUI96564.1 Phosphatase NudJ [Cognatishimia activa]CUK25858.1 Phosphatase NudJ [Cognatishimia activa]